MNYLKIAGKKLAHEMKRFWKDESGMGTVEVILIIVDNYVSLSNYL